MYKTYMIIDSKELLYISIVMIQAFDKLVYDILITREPSSDDNEYDEEMDYGGSQTMHSKDLGTH